MSSFDERLEKELAKLEAEKKKKKKNDLLTGGKLSYLPSSPKQSVDSFLHRQEDDIAPVMTVGTLSKKEEDNIDFFQKGAFDDGYQFGDVSKAILGTVGDVGLNALKGISGIGEGIGDLIAYGYAGVADALGADEFAERTRQGAKVNLVEESTNGAQKFLDQYSVLGRTSDAILQGVGQVGGIIATGSLGAAAGLGTAGTTALTTGLMGASGMGSGMSEAYQGGATDEEAAMYGAISGAADALSELMFGGLGKAVKATGLSVGLYSADDMLAKKVSSMFSSQLAKNIASFGIKAGAEGFEEVFAGTAQAIGKKLTYMSEEDLGKILRDENLLEQFVVGAVTSGIAQAPGLHIANKTGSDFITGQTKNEQAVIKKEVESRIAEAEKDGKKLTAKEKSNIEAQVEKDMEKGYISIETIEEVLGDRSSLDKIEHEAKLFDTLYNTESGKLSKAQQDQLAQLEAKNNATPYVSLIKAEKEKFSNSVLAVVKGDRLSESYNERSRRGQAFEADLTKYDAKQQAVIQKAIDSGILNNTNRTHEFVDMVAKISADKGVLFDFTNNAKLKDSGFAVDGKTVNGYVTKDGITINIDSSKAWQSTVGHEITHVLEGTDMYDALKQTLFDYAKSKGEYDSRLSALTETYKSVKDADIDAELAADLVGDYLFQDSDFIHRLSTENRNVFQKIYDEIKYLYKVATAGSKEARELEKVKKAFEDAYRADSKVEGGTKYSLTDKAKPTYEELVAKNPVQIVNVKGGIESGSYADMKNAAMKKATSEGWFDVPHKNIDTDSLIFLTEKSFSHAYSNLRSDFGEDTIRCMAHIPEIIQNAVLVSVDNPRNPTKQETKVYTFFGAIEGVGGIEPVKLTVKEYDFSTLDAVPKNIRSYFEKNGVMESYDSLYDAHALEVIGIEGIKKESDASGKVYEQGSEAQATSDSKINIADLLNLVKGDATKYIPKNKYSLSDSDGKKLTKEQQEYFKDSKVRDADGNLQIVYHGTRNADFTVFKRNVTFFTDSKGMADSYSPNGAMYEGYVNITKPYEIDAQGEKWSKIPIDVATKNFLQEYGASVFKEGGKWRTTTADLASAIEEAVDNGDMDYDGIIIRNVDDTGSYYKGEGKNVATDYIVFNSNQFKNADNTKPTADKDIRFSLSEAVEETKDLVALHNLTGEKLLKSLKLGGLPMPSVAIAKAKDGHGEFGEISLVLPRETIDPQTSSRNKLYSGDAWTPTYPSVDYKPSEKVLNKVKNKISGLVPYEVRDVLGNLMFDTDNASDYLNRYGGNMVEAYKQNDAMKYAYLKDTGSDISLPMKEADLYHYGAVSNAAVRYFSGKLVNGLQTVELYQNMSARDLLQDKALTEAVADAQNFDVLRTFEPGSAEYLEYERTPVFRAEEVSFRDIDNFLSASRKLLTNGIQQTVDRKAAKELIRDTVDQAAYESWLDDLFDGVVEKEGIRNNKDYFTPSGNRRSFEALHYEHNLENVIKAMREKGEKGIGNGFGGASIFGASTTEFSSIEEMKQSSDRLQTMSYDEYQELRKGFTDRFLEIAMSLPNQKNSFSATDSAAEVLTEAVAKYKTRSGIANYLKRELKGWATYSEQAVNDLIELVNDIRNMPTGYFEAKPQRAVGFDEVAVFIIPYDADSKLKQELLNRGYAIAEYDPNVEGDRTRVLNQFEEYKFSLSNIGEQPRRYGNFYTPATELRYEAPVAENATTEESSAVADKTKATVSETESVAPVVISKNETTTPVTPEEMRELFPDDLAPNELGVLVQEKENLENRMIEMGNTEDFTDFETVNARYTQVLDRIAELENDEADRVGSLRDADIPPEKEAVRGYKAVTAEDPFAERSETAAGDRSVKAYQYENPEVKPFFREAAYALAEDINLSIPAERWYNDDMYYASGGEKGFGGNSRLTAKDVGDFKDQWKCSWDDLREAVNDIIEDHGKENNALSKRVEFLINDRLMYGYTNIRGERIEPNQAYLDFLKEKQINEYSEEAFAKFMETADKYAPAEDIAPVAQAPFANAPAAKEVAPVKEAYEAIRPKREPQPKLARATPAEQARAEARQKGVVKGQQVMEGFAQKTAFEPKTANVLVEEPKVEKKKSGAWSMFKDNFVDKGTIFETLSLKTGNRELQGRWKSIGRAESSAQWFMEHGNISTNSLKSIRDKVEKSGKTKQFYEYLYHLHNVDRMNLEDRYEDVENKPVFGYNVTSDMSRETAAKLEAANPEFKAWSKEVYDYMTYLREMMVDNGVISSETAKLWAEMYPHYVPVRRKGDEGLNINVALDTRRTGVNAPVKKATGGNRDILPLFDTMAMRTEQTFKAVARNRFGVTLKNMLGTTIENEVVDIDEAIDSVETELLQDGKDGKNPTFTVFENGEKVTFEITDEMYDTMKPKSKAMGYTNKVLNTANNIRRGLLTEYNPAFMLTNPIKDTQDVLMNSQHPAKTYANYPKAIAELIGKKGQYYQEYMEHGGEQNTYFDGEAKTFVKEKSGLSKVIGFPLEKISQANNFIERIPRMAEYIASRKEGRSIDVSMLDAARVTTDFSAGGDLVKWANRNGFTFLNASVQGAVQQVRNLREAKWEGAKGWAKLAAKVAAAGLPAMLLNHLLWDDDEEYAELSDYVKQNYYIVAKYGDGKFVRIPKGRTLAVIQDAFQQMENLVTGNDEADWETLGELVISNLAPSNPLDNNLIAPIAQAWNNTTWYGDDLVPTRLQDLPAEEQFDETTDSISKWLGEKLNISPYKINYVLDQYSGAVGDLFLPMLTPEAERGTNTLIAPISDKFTTDSVMKNQNISDFYDKKGELTTNAKASGATAEDVLMNKYMNSINSELSELYAEKRRIQTTNMSDAEKYEAVRDIQKQIVDLTREGLATYDDINYQSARDGEYANIGNRYFKLDDEGEWQKLSDEQATKYKVTSAAGDSSYASDGTNHYRWYEPGEDASEGAEAGWRKVTDKELERQNEVTKGLGISPEEYWSNKEEYAYAYDNPESYAVAKAVGGYDAYKQYSSDLYDIKADKDENGKSISGSRKEKVIEYINGLDVDYGAKLILFKAEYPATDDYNYEIVEYLNSRDDISYEDTVTILTELGFTVSSDGTVTWD